MKAVEKSVEVLEPVSTVYNQWTQFEEFPEFMAGVERVEQLDDRHLRWVADIGGVDREWEAEIVDQVPDERIAWKSVSGFQTDGTVLFEPLGESGTRVTLRMSFQTDDLAEKVGDAVGIIESRVEGDLKRFKEFIEERGRETGAWRGEI